MGLRWNDGYSSHVDLAIVVAGQRLRVAQVGPKSLILQNPCDLEPCFADLIIRVDESVEKYRIALFDGASIHDPLVKYDDVTDPGIDCSGRVVSQVE